MNYIIFWKDYDKNGQLLTLKYDESLIPALGNLIVIKDEIYEVGNICYDYDHSTIGIFCIEINE